MTRSQKDCDRFRLAHWNARGGIRQKYDIIKDFLIEENIDVILIQETALPPNVDIKMRGYKQKKLCTGTTPGHGLLVLSKTKHECVVHRTINNEHAEAMTLEFYINKKNKIYITNLYRRAKYKNYIDSLENTVDPALMNHIVGGDFNIGKKINKLREWSQENDFIIHSDLRTPTRIGYVNQSDTVTDITVSANTAKIELENIKVSENNMNSDHLPVVSEWRCNRGADDGQTTINHTSKYNFKKADWDAILEITNNITWTDCHNEDPDIYLDNVIAKIHKIAEKTIPNTNSKTTQRPKKAKRTVPWWDEELEETKIKKLTQLKTYRRTRQEEDLEEYKKIRNKEVKLIKQKKNQAFKEKVSTINDQTKLGEMWRMVKGMEGSSGKTSIGALKVGHNKYITDKEKAEAIAAQLEKVSSNNNMTQRFSQIREHMETENHENIEKQHLDDKIYNMKFDTRDVMEAIRAKSNKSAPGEDDIAYILLKHLPRNAIEEITKLYNLIWTKGTLPKRWKHSIIIPLLKPGKEEERPESYRPISLTDHLGKIMETMVNDRLKYILGKSKIIDRDQSGFRRKRQTLDQLMRLKDEVDRCRSGKRATVAVFLDLEKAYDMLWREGVLIEIRKIGVSGAMFNYIRDFLKDRTFQVRVGQTLSETYLLENGTPQGAVISPTLFNILINPVKKALERYIGIAMGRFADDTAALLRYEAAPGRASRSCTRSLSRAIGPPVTALVEKLEDQGFKVNIPKTECVFFNNLPSQKEDEVVILKPHGREQIIKGQKEAKYLGVIYDKGLTFRTQIRKSEEKGQEGLNVLRKVSALEWGFNPNTKNLIYKNFILPKMTYGEEVYHTGLKTELGRLDIVQNKAMRLIAGMPKGTAVTALQWMTDTTPLNLRREFNLVKLWTRFQHNPENPANDIFENIPKKMDEKSTVKIAKKSIKKTGLTGQKLTKIVTEEPVWAYERPIIDRMLEKEIKNKSSIGTEEIKNYIDITYEESIKIYTDASLKKGKTGIAVVDETNNRTSKFKLNNNLSVTSAELFAISKAMERAQTLTHDKISIFTDSLKALTWIEEGTKTKERPEIVQKILRETTHMSQDGKKITMVWIPGHIGIEGNERADAEAKKARKGEGTRENIGLNYKEATKIIENELSKEKEKRYEESTLSTVQELRKFITNKEGKIELDKKHNKINKLRCNVPRFRMLHLQHSGLGCRKCRCMVSRDHVLIHCKFFDEERNRVKRALEQIGLELNVVNILSNERKGEALGSIRELIKKIDIAFGI